MIFVISIALLVAGLLVLGWSGDKSVEYAQKLSRLYGLRTLFIGFALLAVSTGIPELSVAITAILSNAEALSTGDLLGSNFADVSLVLGLAAVIGRGIPIASTDYASVVAIWIINCLLMGSVFWIGTLTKWHGVSLIVIYLFSLVLLWHKRHGRAMTYGDGKQEKNRKMVTILKLIGSLMLVLAASELCVLSALRISQAAGIRLALLGATIMALGTSLPEIVLSVGAVRRKDFGMAIGNSFGSVLEQGAFILGILALFSSTPLDVAAVQIVAPFMFAAYALAGYGIIFQRRISCVAGWAMIGLYGAYLLRVLFAA